VPQITLGPLTQLAVISTLYTLIDSVSNRWFSGYVDLTNMSTADGDITEIKAFIKINATPILWFNRVYTGTVLRPLIHIPTLPSPFEYKVTLQQTAGIGKNYDYIFLEP
jgi:hypothetical protein